MSIDLDYFSLGKSEENELCKKIQVVLGYMLYNLYIYIYIPIYRLYNYMVGVIYISYLAPTRSNNNYFSKLVFCLALCNYLRIMDTSMKYSINM